MPPGAAIDDDLDALVAEFRAGSADAVGALYRRYGRLVFSVAVRVLGDRGLAEEASQHTFVQAWKHAGDFERGRDPGPWLATIARRAAIDIHRREARRPTGALDDASPSEPALIALPPNAETIWLTWQVRQAIDDLEPNEREIVRLQHQQGFTHVEIAERLGIAVGTVKSRSFRAHRQLAKRLAHVRDDSTSSDAPGEPEPDQRRTHPTGGEP